MWWVRRSSSAPEALGRFDERVREHADLAALYDTGFEAQRNGKLHLGPKSQPANKRRLFFEISLIKFYLKIFNLY